MFSSLHSLIVSAVLAVVLLGGCTNQDAEDKRNSDVPLTFADVDTNEWINVDKYELSSAPQVPSGVDPQEYEEVTSFLSLWAKRSMGDPSDSFDGIPAWAKPMLEEMSERSLTPEMSLGVPIDSKYAVTEKWATGVWKVVSKDPLQVEYQTRVLWEVADQKKKARLIGLVRTHKIRAENSEFLLGSAWQEFGADDCALVIDEVLRPGGEIEVQNDDIHTFMKIGNSSELEPPVLSEDDVVDEEFLQRCRTGSV